jgi:hypothetical protein
MTCLQKEAIESLRVQVPRSIGTRPEGTYATNSQGYYTTRDRHLEYSRPMALHHRRELHVATIACQRVLGYLFRSTSYLAVPNPERVLSKSALRLPLRPSPQRP